MRAVASAPREYLRTESAIIVDFQHINRNVRDPEMNNGVSDSRQLPSVWPGRPAIKSRFMLSIPARAAWKRRALRFPRCGDARSGRVPL